MACRNLRDTGEDKAQWPPVISCSRGQRAQSLSGGETDAVGTPRLPLPPPGELGSYHMILRASCLPFPVGGRVSAWGFSNKGPSQGGGPGRSHMMPLVRYWKPS